MGSATSMTAKPPQMPTCQEGKARRYAGLMATATPTTAQRWVLWWQFDRSQKGSATRSTPERPSSGTRAPAAGIVATDAGERCDDLDVLIGVECTWRGGEEATPPTAFLDLHNFAACWRLHRPSPQSGIGELLATIDIVGRAGDRGVGHQMDRQCCDIGRGDHAADRQRGAQVRAALLECITQQCGR
jgi:hypothetical protein